MHPDILEILGIMQAEEAREFWNIVGGVFAALAAAALVSAFFYRFRDPIVRAVSFLLKPKNIIPTVCVASAIIYGSTKSTVVVPQTHTADFKQTTSTVGDPVTGQVEYWQSTETTNGVAVALFGGTVTNTFDFTAGQFIYAYDSSISVDTPQGMPNNKLWCRPMVESNWVATTTHSWFNTNGHYAAAIASLPGNKSPNFYSLWFIGPEANLPPVVVEVTGGVDILNVLITSSAVSITFHGTDVRLETGSHTYYLQYRENIDGALTEWATIASTTLSSGVTTGTVGFTGYTVGRYREYRIYTDLELAQ